MPHRSSFRGRARSGISDSQRRKKSWIQVTGPTQGATGGIATPDIQTPNMNIEVPASVLGTIGFGVGSSAALFSDPVLDKVPAESIILRIRGSLNLPKNSVVTAIVENVAVGIAVMEAGAAALGAAPNPASPDGGAWDGWMFYRSQQAVALDANATIIDIKSMRKVESGMAIIVVAGIFQSRSDGVAPQTSSFQVQLNLRALILLP